MFIQPLSTLGMLLSECYFSFNLQLWDPHMQDLGLCEDGDPCDDFNMSDVDLTFENYEDIFAGSEDHSLSLFGDVGATCSSSEKNVSFADSSDHIESAPKVCLLIATRCVIDK